MCLSQAPAVGLGGRQSSVPTSIYPGTGSGVLSSAASLLASPTSTFSSFSSLGARPRDCLCFLGAGSLRSLGSFLGVAFASLAVEARPRFFDVEAEAAAFGGRTGFPPIFFQ